MQLYKYKLVDLCSVITDGSHYSPKAQETGYPMFSVKDMGEYGFSYEDCKRISIEDFILMKKNGCVPKKNDVLVAKDGSYLKESFVCEEEKEEAILSSIALFRPDLEKVNPIFLSYLFKTPYIRKHTMRSCVSGSALPRIILDAFKKLEVYIPSLEIQEKIVKVLKTIDKKIELNKQINCDLEAMAKQLYDYWFVQFDFPNEEGKPYKSSGGKMVWNERLKREIPDGWKVANIEKVLDKYPTTKKFETKEYLKEGLFPIIDQTTDKYFVGYTNDEDNILRRIPAVLFGDHSTCVKFINTPFGRGADGTQILYSNNDKVKAFYLYLSVKNIQIPNPGYSRHLKYLKELPIIIPDVKTSEKFDSLTTPIYKEWSNLIMENANLQKLRDKILPLLMNGQVSIKQ